MRPVIACIALALAAVVVSIYLLSNSGIKEKSIYADLQFAEADGLRSAGEVVDRSRNGHQLAGIETRAGGRVWVYLGGVDRSGGIYSVPGMEQVGVECRLVERLIASRSVFPAVSSALRKTCIK